MDTAAYPTGVAWGAFGASAVATLLTYHFGYALPGWFLWLILEAILSIALGIWVLRLARYRRVAVVLVVLGLLIGQWWLLMSLITLTLWKINGFAP
jgi:hypothetical protein